MIDRVRIRLDPVKFSTANLVRTPGVHLTNVVKDMLRTIGISKVKGGGNSFTAEDLDAYALQGYLWEDAMSETLVNRVRKTDGAAIEVDSYVRLPEIATDGVRAFVVEYDGLGNLATPIPANFIVMSPDGGAITEDGQVHLLECKWTTKGVPAWDDNPETRSDILIKWLSAHRPDWVWQVTGYLKGLSLALGRTIDTVQHHVLFACGDWKVKVTSDNEGRMIPFSPVPVYERWTRKYSEQEVDDKWSAVYNHALDGGMWIK